MLRNLRKLISEIRGIEEGKRMAEIQMTLSQINPHFLYNALEAIHWRAVDSDVPEISRAITDLSHFLRMSLSSRETVTDLANELEQVRFYMHIQQSSMHRQVSLHIEADPRILNARILRLSLQPLVENALVHGISERREPDGDIWIRCRKKNDMLEVSVEDNGAGISNERLRQIRERVIGEQGQDCYALWNVNYRLRSQFGERSALRVQSSEGKGTSVHFDIPYEVRKP